MESQQVHCQVCSRLATAQLPFLCATCGRSRIYEPRIRHAQLLLEKETRAHEVQGWFSKPESERKETGRRADVDLRQVEGPQQDLISADTQRSRTAAAASRHAADETANEIGRLKEEISEKRTRLKQREQTLARKKELVSARGLRAFDPLPGIARKVETDWARLSSAISEDRLFLCTEVANLYGLDLKRRVRDSKTKDVYYLGDVPIVDLRELNNAAPTLVTVSLGRIAHLLHLTSHYLALQLPAEITLPSSSNPHTLIHTPLSSYKDPTLPTGQKNATLSTTKAARQRVLHLDKPLPTLAAEDQVAYSFFVDAVTLLAWNIAWLAKTQGIDIGTRHWDEACAMGRNLWLLFGPQTRMAGHAGSPPPPMNRRSSNDRAPSKSLAMARTPSGDTTATRRTSLATAGGNPATMATATTAAATTGTPQSPTMAPLPGRLTHNSAFAFLPAASAQGGFAETMRSWAFANPIRLIERIKAALANERMGAEWEVVEKEAWEGHDAEELAHASGQTTPRSASEALSGAARMRGLLLGRIPSSDTTATRSSTAGSAPSGSPSATSPPSSSAAGAGGATVTATATAAAGGSQDQRGGWLRVRSQAGSSA